MASGASIHPLSPDVIAQIKSSIAITSLNGVIIELLKNSLDAQARKIDIHVEYSHGSCSVEDDGLGIPPLDFQGNGGLGKLYHTSKHDHKGLKYGSRGSSLASIAALSLISITSHHHKHHSQNTLSINRSQVIARQCPAPPQQYIAALNHGTRVTVRDLFGNMPVRVKQRAIESEKRSGSGREWEDLRKDVISHLLAWPSDVSILIRNGTLGQEIRLQAPRQINNTAVLRRESRLVDRLCNILSHGSLIKSSEQNNWVPVDAATGEVQIHGAMSLDLAPTKAVQFISFGINPIGIQGETNVLYEEINRIVDKSSFGSRDEQADLNVVERMRRSEESRYKNAGFISSDLRGSKKRVDRWPMFFFKVDLVDSITGNVDTVQNDDLAVNRNILNSIVDLLRAMILEFLKCHYFQNKSARLSAASQDLSSVSPEDFSHLESRVFSDRELDLHEQTNELQNNHPRDRRALCRVTSESSKGMNSERRRLESQLVIQTKRIESPFNMWSRVKSGRSKIMKKISEEDDDLQPYLSSGIKDKIQKLSRATSTRRQNRMSSNFSSLIAQGTNTTLVRSGKVIRPPFGELHNIPSKSSPIPDISSNNVPVPEASNSSGDGEVMTWIDQISEETSQFNVRTGLAVQLAKERVVPSVGSSEEQGSLRRVSIKESSLEASILRDVEHSTWVSDILRKWDNPVFSPTESAIPKVPLGYTSGDAPHLLYRGGPDYSQSEVDQALRTSSASHVRRISKIALRQAQLVSQVDKKFILIMMPLDLSEFAAEEKTGLKRLLAIVDQHAADERCHVEDLLDELCSTHPRKENISSEARPQPGILTTTLEKPLNFAMPRREIHLLRVFSQHFADWGILFDIPLVSPGIDQHKEERVTVRSLPPGIVERCKMDPKLLIELLRSEAWKCHENLSVPESIYGSSLKNQVPTTNITISESHAWLKRIHRCPQGILDMLNSRSCRSAIMFNDELSYTQCRMLLSRLVKCAFPFQCAHGRPSMIPLLDLGTLHERGLFGEGGLHDCEEPFGVRFKRWKHEMVE